MATCDLAQLVAIAPPGAGRIHLHLPGYKPGRKRRSQANAPLCGVYVYRDQPQASLEIASNWPHVRATWAGSGDAGARYWCPPCLGRLTVLLGEQDGLIRRAQLTVSRLRDEAGNQGLTPP